ncbi:MAG: S9 family peptidase, partial [Sphingomicrobium sp.]
MNDFSAPPRAAQKPHSSEHHGVTIDDPWAWLRDPKYPEVTDPEILDYLKAENAFFDGWKARHQPLLDTLFKEMRGRIKEDDSSVPIKDGDWLYWWAFRPGAQYRTWYRKPVAGGDEQIIYDEPAEAAGKEYFVLGAMEVSPDHKLIATLVDDNGSERFALRIRDLASGKDIETVTNVGIGQPSWSNDSKGVIFTEVNDQWRSYRARYHRLGGDPAKAVTLYEETEDLGFSVGIGKSQDESTIFIATGDNTTSEVRFVPADDPSQPLTLISRRMPNREYDVDAAHGKLWILTNDDHINFRLAEADPAAAEQWTTVIPGSDAVYLTDATPYRDWLAITRRVGGLDQLALRDYSGAETPLPFEEASFTAYFHGNPEFAPATCRVGYSSMVTPTTVFDYHPETRLLEVRKVQEIPSGYDGSLYATERIEVTARDGIKVPVSVVYKKGFPRDGSGRLFLYAYGAYGHAIAPTFNSNRLSLLDCGFACAIAHIRGGDDLGY